MKNVIIASAIAMASVTASATEVTLSGVYDYEVEKEGVRVTAAFPGTVVEGVTPQVSYTGIDGVYNRYAVGAAVDFYNTEYFSWSVVGAGVYQDTHKDVGTANGYGLTAGVAVTAHLADNVYGTLSAEQFWGQDRVSQFDGTTVALGLGVRF